MIRVTVRVATSIAQMSQLSSSAQAYTMLFPSGDQDGAASGPGVRVSGRSFAPLESTSHRSLVLPSRSLWKAI